MNGDRYGHEVTDAAAAPLTDGQAAASSVGCRARQTIALCMIVRNEATVLGRCIESVGGLIDSWVICDTGSTDGTTELVRSALAGLPGRLLESRWVDFGHNRSELLAAARGAADYLLLLDADMTIVRRGELPSLDADAYVLRTVGELDYGVLRLVRGDREWWYEGSTHEYLATNGRFEQAELDALAVEHHGDGSSRAGKLLRDAGLLKRDLVRNPDNPRPVFYLAQTFRDLGQRELAIEYYRRRVDLGGWDEEVFYANLQEGVLRADADDELAPSVLLEAWERRPSRAEPLFELARLHRRRGDFAVARLFANEGLRIPAPNDLLFVHRAVYDWGMLLERALAEAGLGHLDRARAELTALLARPLPRSVEQRVARILIDMDTPGTWGAGELARVAVVGQPANVATGETDRADGRRRRQAPAPRLATLAPSVQIGEIALDVRPAWPSFNPSIAQDGEGFRMIVRTANYEIERGVRQAAGILQNVNYLVQLDSGLGVSRIAPLVDRSPALPRFASLVEGYEDCRLFDIEGTWYVTATVADLNGEGLREVALLQLEDASIVKVRRLAGPRPGRHEKNWMPVTIGGRLHLVYSVSPTVVLRCDPESGETERVAEHAGPEIARGFRGGSQGVAFDDGYLFVVHEVDRRGPGLCYLHRFVQLAKDLHVRAISPQFTFTGDRIEFCAGMARRGERLLLSFGVSDAAAGLALVQLDEVDALLRKVDDSPPARAGHRPEPQLRSTP